MTLSSCGRPSPGSRAPGFAILLLVFWSVLTATTTLPASAATLHVDDSNAGPVDGSAAHPYRTIQAAVNAASSGDTIKVADGSYDAFQVVNEAPPYKEVLVYGGYSPDFQSRGSQYTSIVSGNATTPAVSLWDCGHTTIDGFVITGGAHGVQVDGTDWYNQFPDRVAPVISNNIIENNGNESVAGGGLALDGCNAQVLSNVIRDNRGSYGGGLQSGCWTLVFDDNQVIDNRGYADHGGGLHMNGTITFRRNRVEGNVTGLGFADPYGWGGGALVYGSSSVAHFDHNVWTRNHAPSIGSGLFIDDGATATVDHDLFYDQQCAQSGGQAIYVDGTGNGEGSTLTVTNVTIAENNCNNYFGGGAIYVERDDSSVTVKDSIIWHNGGDDFLNDAGTTITVSYTDSEESVAGTGNISVDPRFADPAAGDFHVRSTHGRYDPASGTWVLDASDSLTIDAGDPASAYDLEPSPNGSRVNMGHTGDTPYASLSAGGVDLRVGDADAAETTGGTTNLTFEVTATAAP